MRLSSHQDKPGWEVVSRQRAASRHRPVIEELEPRILYSADFSPALLDAAPVTPVAEHRVVDASGEFQYDVTQQHQARQHEVVFVDTATPDYQALVDDIQYHSNAEHQVEVILLDQSADGIQQITDTLATRKDITAVHIIGHGADGVVELGKDPLNFESLLENATQIKGWGNAFASGADLLIYGCDVAQNAEGRALVDALSRLTGADVSASEDLTGSAAKGANWDLEYSSGIIQTPLVISKVEQLAWNGILDLAASGATDPAQTTQTQVSSKQGIDPTTPSVEASAQPVTSSPSTEQSAAAMQASIVATPLAFEQNVGQADAQVDFLARGNGYAVGLTGGNAILAIQDGASSQIVGLNIVGKNDSATGMGQDLLQSKTNYLVGGEDQWRTDIANFGAVQYDSVYHGIDVRYYGNQRQLEYDFLVNPGASVTDIQLKFDGVQSTSVADNGDLVLTLDNSGHTISFKAPVAYQDGPNGREAVASHYRINDDGTIGFDVGSYDANRQLVIDPVLSYATYFGGTGADVADGVAVDSAGNFYLTGYTASTGLLGGKPSPLDPGDVFVAKFSPTGSLIYSTAIGGSGFEEGTSIAVDASGNAYVTGYTSSIDFPTASAIKSSLGLLDTQDAFVFKLNAAGSALAYSTYLGGSGSTDIGWAIGLDAAGNAYMTGAASAGFPTTIGPAYGGNGDAFVTKLTSTGALGYSTFLGGSNEETGYGIAVDAAGNVVAVGETTSTNLLTTANALQPGFGGGSGANAIDGFVTRLNSTGVATYTSYLGGNRADLAYNVALDSSGKIYVTGETSSRNNFPVTPNALQTSLSGSGNRTDAFVTVIDPSLSGAASLIYSTYLGGATGDTEAGLGIGVDSGGRVYVGGRTDSTDLPTTTGAYQTSAAGGEDAFFVIINPLGSGAGDRLYGTYFGGSGDDYGDNAVYDSGKFYLVGETLSTGIATLGSYDPSFATPPTGPNKTDGFAAIFTIAPSVTTTSGSLAYVENDGARVLDGGAAVSDPGFANLAGATLQITGNYANGEDVLAFNNANSWGITGTWDSVTATLTLTGSSSVANYQLAVRSVTYQNTSENPSTATRTVTLTANDGVLVSAPATRQIAVTSVNDAPTLVAPGAYAASEQTALNLAGSITLGDVDGGAGSETLTLSVGSGILNAAAGTTGVVVVGSGSNSVTLSGTTAQLTNLLNGALGSTLSYLNNSDTPPASDTLTLGLSDNGNTGSGGAKTATASSTINITAVNDAPVVAGGSVLVYTENQAGTAINGAVTVSDADNATLSSATVAITGNYAGGEDVLGFVSNPITMGNITGLYSSGTGVMVLTSAGATATTGQWQAALRAVSYTNTSDNPSTLARTVSYTVNDGAIDSNAVTSTVNVTSVNDAPTLVAPGAYAASEQTALNLAGSITLGDVDGGAGSETLTLSVGSGILNAAAGTTGVVVVGSGSNSVTLSGTTAQLTNLLNGALGSTLSYLNNSDTPPASDTLTLGLSDNGNTGSGGAKTATASSTINITAVNDAPTLVTPGAQSAVSNTPLTFGGGNAISVADVDASGGVEQVTLSVVNGSLTLGSTVGLTSVTGNGSASVVFRGTLPDLNNALNGLTYTPNLNYSGADTLSIASDDLGNSGGGALTANGTVNLSVQANQAPTLTATANNPTFTEAAGLFAQAVPVKVFSAAADSTIESGQNIIGLTFTLDGLRDGANESIGVDGSVLTLGAASSGTTATNGVSYSVTLGGTTTATVTLSSAAGLSTADLATLVDGITYQNTNTDNPSAGGRIFRLTQIQDSGGSLNGGSDTTALNIVSTVNVVPVNDALVNLVPGSQSTLIDTPIVLSGANAISISDVDANGGIEQITLTVSQGTVTLGGTTGLTFSAGTGTGDTTVVFSGSLSDLNNALNGLSYTPANSYIGVDLLSVTSDDLGNTGTGGPQTVTSAVAINVSYSAPGVTTSGGGVSYTENSAPVPVDAGLTLSTGSYNDLTGATVQISGGYALSEDLLTLVSQPGISQSWDATSGTLTLSGTATVATYQAALQQVRYQDTSNDPSTATRTVIFTISDGVATPSAAQQVSVTAVNDAPALTAIPLTSTFQEAAGLNTLAPAANVFGSAAAGTVEAGQTIIGLTFNVAGLRDGANESIVLDGSTITLGANSTGTTATNGIGYSVTLSGTTAAAISLTSAGGVSAANIATLIDGITYQNTNTDNPSAGTRIFTLTQIQDSGGTANGGQDAATLTVAASVNVVAVNDAPANSIPGAQTTNANTSLIFSAANGVSVLDVDANAAVEQVMLGVAHGTLSLSSTTGLTLVSGANGSASMTYRGTLANLNTALNGLTYTPANNYSGADALSITSNDQGSTGSGGALISATTVGITVNAPPPVVVPPPAPPPPAPTPTPGPTSPPTPAPPTPVPPSSSPPSGPSGGGSTPTGGSGVVPDPAQPVAVALVDQTPAQALVVGDGRTRGADLIRTQSVGLAAFGLGAGSPQEAMLPAIHTETLTISSMDPEFARASETLKLAAYRSTLGNKDWVGELNRMREDIVAEPTVEHRIVGSTVAVTGAMSVGYVIWLLRGGLLLSSLLSSLPAWHTMDPMPVLARSKNSEEDGEDDDPLENLFGRAKAAIGLGRSRPGMESAQAQSTPALEKARQPDEEAAIPA